MHLPPFSSQLPLSFFYDSRPCMNGRRSAPYAKSFWATNRARLQKPKRDNYQRIFQLSFDRTMYCQKTQTKKLKRDRKFTFTGEARHYCETPRSERLIVA